MSSRYDKFFSKFFFFDVVKIMYFFLHWQLIVILFCHEKKSNYFSKVEDKQEEGKSEEWKIFHLWAKIFSWEDGNGKISQNSREKFFFIFFSDTLGYILWVKEREKTSFSFFSLHNTTHWEIHHNANILIRNTQLTHNILIVWKMLNVWHFGDDNETF
jgi:hypothetical protein